MEKDFTKRVLDAYSNIDNARLKEIMQTLIKHLHACISEMKLTDKEFEFTWNFLERMAKFTGPEETNIFYFWMSLASANWLRF